MKRNRHLIQYIAAVAIALVAIAMPILAIFSYTHRTTEADYSLSTIEDGIYGIYHTVSSTIPANNYEVITVCADGSLRTFEGRIYIYYDSQKPSLHYVGKNTVHGDEVHVHVPKGSIRIDSGVGTR